MEQEQQTDAGTIWDLVAILMIVVGVYWFLYGLIRNNTRKGSLLFLGYLTTISIMLLSGMLLYDRWLAPVKIEYLEAVQVSVSVANVRSSPEMGNNIVGRIQQGKQLPATKIHKSWTNIKYNGTDAWIHNRVVKHGYSQIKQVRWLYLEYVLIFLVVLHGMLAICAYKDRRNYVQEYYR